MLNLKENEGNRRDSRRRSLRSGLVSFSIICCADTLAYGQKPKHKSSLEMEAVEVVLVVVVEYGNNASLFAFCCNMEIRFLSTMAFRTVNCNVHTEVSSFVFPGFWNVFQCFAHIKIPL